MLLDTGCDKNLLIVVLLEHADCLRVAHHLHDVHVLVDIVFVSKTKFGFAKHMVTSYES